MTTEPFPPRRSRWIPGVFIGLMLLVVVSGSGVLGYGVWLDRQGRLETLRGGMFESVIPLAVAASARLPVGGSGRGGGGMGHRPLQEEASDDSNFSIGLTERSGGGGGGAATRW